MKSNAKMTDINDTLISILQKVEAATLEKKLYDWSKDLDNELYYKIALQHKYILGELGNRRVSLTPKGKIALTALIKTKDKEQREIERHNREKHLMRATTCSTYFSAVSTIVLTSTLCFTIWNSNRPTVLMQPIKIDGNIQVLPTLPLTSDHLNSDTDGHNSNTDDTQSCTDKENSKCD